jgi:hypothetical protein
MQMPKWHSRIRFPHLILPNANAGGTFAGFNRRTAMGIHMKFDPTSGAIVSVDADTAAEAASFAIDYAAKKAVSTSHKAPPKTPPARPSRVAPIRGSATGRDAASQLRIETTSPGSAWDEATVSRYFEPLRGYSLRFMIALVDRATMNSDEMATLIDAPVNVMGPTVRTLATQAEKLGRKAPFTTELLKPKGKRYHIVLPFRDAALPVVAAMKRAA